MQEAWEEEGRVMPSTGKKILVVVMPSTGKKISGGKGKHVSLGSFLRSYFELTESP